MSFDPAEFGVDRDLFPRERRASRVPIQSFGPSAVVNEAGSLRTGLSEAIVTDLEDDAYDLSWLAQLPGNDMHAIAKLRELLQDESDPIDRHYMYAELEPRLYRAGQAFPAALHEYDQVCRAHDSEMESIRAALVAKFGVVPLLETYRQSSIRHQKAKRYDEALWWSTRGIEIYGSEAARPDFVADLEKRSEKSRAKLHAPPKPRSRQKAASASPADRPMMETLTCQDCGREFTRQVMRGRKPRSCPDCRSQPA